MHRHINCTFSFLLSVVSSESLHHRRDLRDVEVVHVWM